MQRVHDSSEDRAYDKIVRGIRFVVGRFFRSVEVTGREYIPSTGGGVLVSWHPNGMIDPALILAHFPRRVVFGARHGLFKWPILGGLMRAIGTVPIHRAMDRGGTPESRRDANTKSLDALAQAVASGDFACLFPEGDSHDAPHLIELRTGAARFFLRARELEESEQQSPLIIPVGLHYDSKRSFRSNVLVAFHPPIDLSALELDGHDAVRSITAEIENALREVVHATETWELHHLMHRVRKLVRAERAHRAEAELGEPDMAERTLGFARVWAGYYEKLRSQPESVSRLRREVERYDATLRAMQLEDHELDRSPRWGSRWLISLLLLQFVFVFFLLPPFLVVGYIVNAIPAFGLWLLSKTAAKKRKDEATIKLFFGLVAFPVTWIAAGLAAGFAHQRIHELYPSLPNTPVAVGLTVAALGILGGMAGLRYLRLARETLRSIRVRLTRAMQSKTIRDLRASRAALYDAVTKLVSDVKLPGVVGPDGKVSVESSVV